MNCRSLRNVCPKRTRHFLVHPGKLTGWIGTSAFEKSGRNSKSLQKQFLLQAIKSSKLLKNRRKPREGTRPTRISNRCPHRWFFSKPASRKCVRNSQPERCS